MTRRAHLGRVALGVMLAATLAAAGTACITDSRRTLRIFTPHDERLRTELEVAFEREHPQVDIEWVVLGAQEILERLRAEREEPSVDLWFGGPADRFAVAAREGLLAPHEASWRDLAPPGARDSADAWIAIYRTPLVIGYRRDAFPANDAPRDWDDLAAPAWKDRLVLRDPRASGSMQMLLAARSAQAVSRDGSSAAALQWITDVDRNVRAYVGSPATLYQQLARKEGVVTVWNLPELEALPKTARIPIAWSAPPSGVPVVLDAIALVGGRPSSDDARAFVEFVSSRAMSELAAKRHGRWPVRPDVDPAVLPAWTRDSVPTWRTLPLDLPVIADSIDGWMRPWTARVAARGVRK